MRNINFISGCFERRTPESQGIPSSAITDCLDEIIRADENVHSLHVFRNGYQIAGGCAKPFDMLTPRRVYSTMKSVICIAVLFLVQEGKLSFENKVVDFFGDAVPKNCSDLMKSLSVRNILNMSVGHELDALRIFHETNYGAGMIPFTLRDKSASLSFNPEGMTLEQIFFSLPMAFRPGERFCYVNSVPEMLIRLITKACGEDFIHYLQPRFFEPLSIDVFNCQETWMEGWAPDEPFHRPDEAVIGYLDGATTVTSTQDLCKFALFLLQDGCWEGVRLLSHDLIKEATALHLPTKKLTAKPNYASDMDSYGYGMQIWRNQYGGFKMAGGSGQAAIMIPELEFAVVYTAMNTHLATEGTVIPELVRDCLYKEIRYQGIDENPEEYMRMQQRFESWSTAPENLSTNPDAEGTHNGKWNAAEECDGITALDFAPESSKVTIWQGERSCELVYGARGDFVVNRESPLHKAEGYSYVYGSDRKVVSASGGWKSTDGRDSFVLQLQYACDMVAFRYCAEFLLDRIIKLRRMN